MSRETIGWSISKLLSVVATFANISADEYRILSSNRKVK